MTREEALENAYATARWLKDEDASPAAIFTFLAHVLNHSLTWRHTKMGHSAIAEVHTKLHTLAVEEGD